MHTPRLCIDGRCDRRKHSSLVAEEIVNQLVASHGDAEAGNEWVDKGRTVLLAHPDQVFEGQWRRYNTKMHVGISPIYWAWERNFVQEASLTVFQKFRSSDRLGLGLPCTSLTTVLSPGSIPKAFQWASTRQVFVVPSHQDRTELSNDKKIPVDQIHVIHPTIRRYCHFAETPDLKSEGQILVIHDGRSRYRQALTSILNDRFPSRPIRVISAKNRAEFEPPVWLDTLRQTLFAFYLVETPFDWATAALETIYWGIPTFFQNEHGPLNELLPSSPLRLSQFLIDQPDISTLKGIATSAYQTLEECGVFEPLAYARQFKGIYESLPQVTQ